MKETELPFILGEHTFQAILQANDNKPLMLKKQKYIYKIKNFLICKISV